MQTEPGHLISPSALLGMHRPSMDAKVQLHPQEAVREEGQGDGVHFVISPQLLQLNTMNLECSRSAESEGLAEKALKAMLPTRFYLPQACPALSGSWKPFLRKH